MPNSDKGDQRESLTSHWWGAVVTTWFAAMILTGGTTAATAATVSFHAVTSAAIGCVAIWRLRGGFPTWVSAAGTLLMALSFGLLLLHVLPLPPDVWTAFPGREILADTLAANGNPLPWHPLSLQPALTYGSALSMLPASAAFLAALTLKPHSAVPVVVALLCCAVGGVVLGLFQRFSGTDCSCFFYGPPPKPTALGTFSNRNFFGAQLFTAIPFAAALALLVAERWRIRPWVMALFAVAYTGVLLAGLAAVGSRGGVLLAMVAVILTFAFVFRWHRFAQSGATVLASLAALFVLSQVSMVGILRLAERDSLQDFRTTILRVSYEAAKAFFPAGSGFGTFVSAYQLHERPADIIDSYVNQAHNDWLELVLVGGLPALLLMVAFLVLLGFATVRIFRFGLFSPAGALYRAALVCVFLLLLHAIVDFGLRTPALLTVFAMSLGLITLPGALQGQSHRPVPERSGPVAPPRQGARPFTPGRFGQRAGAAATGAKPGAHPGANP